MNPTSRPMEILEHEHRVIEVVLGCLEQMARQSRDERRIPVDDARSAIDFFRTFADRCHHGKEETHLFAAMTRRGFPSDEGPIAQMLFEHETGRDCIGEMAAAIDDSLRHRDGASSRFAEQTDRYVALLREHIQKEDDCLFPMADEALDETELGRLEEAFAGVESEELDPGTHDRCVVIARELARRYSIPQDTIDSPS